MTTGRQMDRIARLIAGRAGVASDAQTAHRRRAARYPTDPVGYARDVLGGSLTPQQSQICELALKPPYRVLVPSANTQGKTRTGAVFASWFYDTFDPGITLITATTRPQVRDLMFRELRDIRPPFDFAPKDTRLQSSPSHFVHGFTANKPDAFQGRHGTNLCLIFDEATGIDRAFWDRAKTMHQPHEGHAWLCFYNPNDSSSVAFEEEESGGWHVVRLNALDHPNVAAQLSGLPPLIPAAIRLETVLARLISECEAVADADLDPTTDFQFPPDADREWPGAPGLRPGQWWRPKRAAFEAQVLGRWPLIATESLFTPQLVDQCFTRRLDIDPDWLPQIGCDVARFGDDRTAIVVRRGPIVLHTETAGRRDTKWIADRLIEASVTFAPSYASVQDRLTPGSDNTSSGIAKRIPIVVDGTGGYGAGVVDQLLSSGHNAVELSMSAQSPDPRILRMRSYLWWHLSEVAHAGLLDMSRLDPSERAEVRADLAAQRYKIDEVSGKKVLIPKSQTKSRLGRSPDLGDALALAFYS